MHVAADTARSEGGQESEDEGKDARHGSGLRTLSNELTGGRAGVLVRGEGGARLDGKRCMHPV